MNTATIAANAAITAANAAIAGSAGQQSPVGHKRSTGIGADTDVSELAPTLQRLRDAWQAGKPDEAQRRNDLQRLRDALKRRLDEMATAISADFGHRSREESVIADGMTVLNDIDHVIKHLRRWMKPSRVGVGWRFLPARAQLRPSPVGVVGVIAPWNYPVNLSLIPLATAIAAGNHVYLKPSEHTPRTSQFLRALLAEVFPPERVAVATGSVFRGWDGVDRGVLDPAAPLATLRNDLAAPAIALAPVIATVVAALEQQSGVSLVRMSGSGATVFALFESDATRSRATQRLAAQFPGWWLAGTALR